MKGKSILEVLLVFTLFKPVGWALGLTGFFELESSILGWSYSAGLIMILIPVSILLVTERSFESYGITLKRWRHDLEVGMTCFLVLLIPKLDRGAVCLCYASS